MALRTPYGPEVRIRIGGPAGFGIKAAGQSLARVFARKGFSTFDLTEYPSLIKGGHNTYHLRVSPAPIHSHVMATDVLVALDRQSARLHVAELTPGGALIHDPDDFVPDANDTGGRTDLCIVPVPLTAIVREAGGIRIMRNVAALGATLGHLGLELDGLIESIRAQFAHKAPEIAEQNVRVATAGWEHARRAHCPFPVSLTPPAQPPDLLLLDGNEAIGLGALAAGVGLYAAYPMTPASSLLHFMARHGERYGVVVKHTEDEIAAMNMVVGAAFGGTRAMCATSGGGFSLMVEALGLAGVSETPVVVGLFTRPGPATGMPTWTEQSDLRFAIHASQGEFPRVVLAPGTHAEAFEFTWRAFNIADELQTPVILLGDSYLSDNRAAVPSLHEDRVTISRGKLVTEGDVADHPDALLDGRYARYRVTDDGISVRAIPGVLGAIQVVNSYEHDEYGYGAQGEIAANRVAQNEKRLRKLDQAAPLVPPPIVHGPPEAEVSLVFFGSTTMPALEALAWLAAEGHAVNALQVRTVHPFPAAEVLAFLESANIVLCVEGNATGQLEGLIRERCLVPIHHRLHRYDGRPFSPEMIYAAVKRLLGEPVPLTDAGAILPSMEVDDA